MKSGETRKILFLITKSTWGGAGRYVFDLATRLEKNNYHVTVAAGGGGPLLERCRQKGISTIPIVSLGRDINFFQDIRSFWEILTLLQKERPDILHLNSSKVGLLGALAGRIAGIHRIIFTAHGWASTENRPLLSRLVIHLLHTLTVLLSHHTIAVSRATKEELKLPQFLSKKITVIHNGISAPPFYSRQTARETLREKGVHDHGTIPWIGTIAELHPNKGLLFALSALSLPEIKDLPFVWVIMGDGELRETMLEKIKAYNLEEKVFLVGFVPEAAMYLSAFDVFLFPSIKEGLPYVLLEAGAANLPVIASEIGGIPEIILGGRTGFLIPPKNPQAIAQILSGILRNSLPPRFNPKNIGHALGVHVQENFSLAHMTTETERLY